MKSYREAVKKYVFDKYSTEAEMPWKSHPTFEVLRRSDNSKWYGVIMGIPKTTLGLRGSGNIDVINVKCDSFLIGSLMERNGFFPAYHMNKLNWITVSLEGNVTLQEVEKLVDLSFEMTYTKPKVKKNRRLQYHFEPQKGWMNDPNGLIYFNGLYHAFFQHNPYDVHWGKMHWGHAVSSDLLHWNELDIALYPDEIYEDKGGCFSGSAIEKDGKMYLFYTGVSEKYDQAQCLAVSSDGLTFEKYKNNPIIFHFPEDGSYNFRDPKVTLIDGKYYMVVGSGKGNVGKILLYTSKSLYDWEYLGVLFEDEKCGIVLECPDFFKLDDKYVLMFSKMGRREYATQFIVGDFDGRNFVETSRCCPEAGPQFYAPQTFLDGERRRIMIGWFYDWGKKVPTDAKFAGGLTIPRELSLCDGKIKNFPVEEASHLLKKADDRVKISGRKITLADGSEFEVESEIKDVSILCDNNALEIFVNGGENSFSVRLD